MAISRCVITLIDYNDTSLTLFRTIGGDPRSMVPVFGEVLSLGRRGLTVEDFASRVAGCLGPQGCRSLSIHPSNTPTLWPHEYRYDITFDKRIFISVHQISDANVSTLLYEGPLEFYLTRELRKPKPRRGRPPVGFLDKDEQNREENVPKSRSQVFSEILNERDAEGVGPAPDLRGVRIYTHQELAKKRAARKAKSRAKKLARR